MPSRPYRTGELHQHSLRQQRGRPPDLQIALRRHPLWRVCDRCDFPIDPAVGDTHPWCDPNGGGGG